MPSVALYTFRAAGNPVVFYLVGGSRFQVRGETDRLQMGIAAADIKILDPAHSLFALPIGNP